jgi:hypothetical protein
MQEQSEGGEDISPIGSIGPIGPIHGVPEAKHLNFSEYASRYAAAAPETEFPAAGVGLDPRRSSPGGKGWAGSPQGLFFDIYIQGSKYNFLLRAEFATSSAEET